MPWQDVQTRRIFLTLIKPVRYGYGSSSTDETGDCRAREIALNHFLMSIDDRPSGCDQSTLVNNDALGTFI